MNPHAHPPGPPESWQPARRMAVRILKPLERFLHVEASSGIVLLVAAVVAMVWANSPWAAAYEALWHAPLGLSVGPYAAQAPLHFVVNDGLMTIFFLVVGLEIRREIHQGELSELKRAALPALAALGGMLVPALLYLALARAPSVRSGWGVPMATDIAFAVGVLALVGRRVPAAVRVLLLALAIIDDIGAIIVIALFYSGGVSVSGLALAVAGAVAIHLFQRIGVRRAMVYALPGALLWFGMHRAGIHPTIAGVIIGLLTPVRTWFGAAGFVATAREAIDEVRHRGGETDAERTHEMLGPLRRVRQAQLEAVSPVVRVEAALHPWVAYGIMPLFALANAGVSLEGLDLADASARSISVGVFVGLVAGKPLGIFLTSYVGVRLGLCALPRGVDWRSVLLVGVVAGIGFTMAIFIAGLAFADPSRLAAAKLGVLAASAVSALAGVLAGRALLPPKRDLGAADSVDEAETSTER